MNIAAHSSLGLGAYNQGLVGEQCTEHLSLSTQQPSLKCTHRIVGLCGQICRFALLGYNATCVLCYWQVRMMASINVASKETQ